MIDSAHLQLLKILSEVLSGQHTSEDRGNHVFAMDKKQLRKLFEDSIHHQVFTLLMDGLHLTDSPEDSQTDGLSAASLQRYQILYRNEIIRQAQKTADFQLFYEYLASKGLHPIVMKGIVCRDLYVDPEHRPSSDEDLLIDPMEFEQYHQAVLDYGLTLVSSNEDIHEASEVSYQNDESHLYIEIHKALFAEDSKAYGNLNTCFEGVLDRVQTKEIYGTTFYVLNPTDHLLYMILHALKHFLYSGFGIRQVCDLILFAERYREEIDWEHLSKGLTKVYARDFARALFKIGVKYLLPENHLQSCLSSWHVEKINEEPLLIDIMEGGLYGASSKTRLHSSNMTLSAMEAKQKGVRKTRSNRTGRTVLKSVFPPLKGMRTRYPYLNKAPFLLPAAWVQRMAHYLKETRRSGKGSTIKESSESIRLGKERVELLKKYHII